MKVFDESDFKADKCKFWLRLKYFNKNPYSIMTCSTNKNLF